MSTVGPDRLRVVLDTNVYISACTHPLGRPSQIWQHAVGRRYALVSSPAIIRETARILRDRLEWDEAEIIRRVKLLARVAEIVSPELTLQVVANDETDNRIVECAVAGKAGLIVSGDQHLLVLKSFEGIGIVRPVDFHRILNSLLVRG